MDIRRNSWELVENIFFSLKIPDQKVHEAEWNSNGNILFSHMLCCVKFQTRLTLNDSVRYTDVSCCAIFI